jgi:hypothetical protein
MRALRFAAALGAAFVLVACEAPPTDLADGPSFKSAFEEDMIVPWFYYEGPQWVPCANGGEGAEFWWSAELAGFGKEHVTPSGNYHEVLKVEFRNVEFRSPTGELYPFRKVVQQNVVHTFQQDGRTVLKMTDNEFYTDPNGRNVKWQAVWHLVTGGDGHPQEVERFAVHCSPAKW